MEWQKHLRPGAHIHLMGICGTAMASLAGLLKESGYKVTGSDQNVYPPMSTQLAALGITIMEGYKKENLVPRPDLVIVGNVISRKMEEAEALLASDIPYTSLPAAMGELVIAHRHSIVVSGTHGKTTTTSMMSFLADQLGLRPGFLIGGIPKNFSRSFQIPQGDWFVIEGDEYDTAFFDKVPKFIHYRPRSVILTSVEFDHADIYKDLEDVKQAFLRLLKLIPKDGRLITNAEDENIGDLLKRHHPDRVVTFGLEKGDYQAREVKTHADGMRFKVLAFGKVAGELDLKISGDYNIRNALAAFALANDLGWDINRVQKIFSEFQGVKRRQEIIGTPNNITVIEDFAHHPTAVKGTMELVRTRYPKARVFAVFEPRSATSRRKIFQKDYVEALGLADVAIVPKPYNQSSIAEGDRFSTEELIGDLQAGGHESYLCEGVDAIVAKIQKMARPSDVVVLMSNGGFEGIYQKLLAALA